VHIVDTAGRHALEDDLIAEIEEIERAVPPTARCSCSTPPDRARKQARQFEKSIGIEGRDDHQARRDREGWGALTAVNETDSSIAFLGTGETVQDIERFEPSGFISRLLGMGDLKQLSERVERAMAGGSRGGRGLGPRRHATG